MIVLAGVRFGYTRGADALRCDHLEIGPGLTLLLGANGAGKSTLLKLAAGVERPAAGTVSVNGHDLWRDEVAARRTIAYVPEQPDLTPYATVEEVLRLVCDLRGERPDRGGDALSRVGLDGLGERSIRQLSMGQRRRAVLASAFIGAPTTLLLDEPLEAMDRAMRDSIVTWMQDAVASGATVLVATHEIEPFIALAHRAIVVTSGSPEVIDPLPADPAARLALLDDAARQR